MALHPYELSRVLQNPFQDPFQEMRQMFGMLPYWAAVPDDRLLDIGNEAGEVENDPLKFAVHVDVSQFRPEELKTHVDGHTLTIEGHHKERTDKHGSIERWFKRCYDLPEECDLAGVRSSIENDGKLAVLAPKKTALCQRKEIPIKTNGAIVNKRDS